jgi:membrane protease YdiL (CAAX protease family)
MVRVESDPPSFGGGSLVPVAAYLLTVVVLSALTAVSGGGDPPPVLGMAWGVFLAALALGALAVEGASPRSVLPSARSAVPAVGVVAAFWALYNAVAYGLAVAGVPGFEAAPSRAVAHPLLYLAALGSSLLFTAVPEELAFRGYLQSKVVSLAGGDGRRALAVGVGVASALFALFHLPRWFLASGHGVGAALARRLLGLALAGVAYGVVYALTRILWLVALFHATMNRPPLLVAVDVPPGGLHLLVGLFEYATVVLVAVVAVRALGDGSGSPWRRPTTSAED